ncbi:MAG: hypothetical protein ACTHN5_12625 [Phycisphaerae bacterium]
MTLDLLFAWWNLIYVVPFGLALIYLGLYVFTGLTFGEGDAEVDHEIAVEHDVDADGDHDVWQDAGDAHEQSMDGGGSSSALMSALSLLGVGRVPLSLALMILLILWGVIGLAINQGLMGLLGATAVVGLISVPVTAGISVAVTGLIARVLGRVMPTSETYARKRGALVGCVGEALYGIDAAFGLVSVREPDGDLFQVECRTAAGEPGIAKGTKVVLFKYDAEKAVFYVAPFVSSQAVAG